jgi:hypothetical protein
LQKSKEKNWLQQNADDADLELDDYLIEEMDNKGDAQQNDAKSKEIQSQKKELYSNVTEKQSIDLENQINQLNESNELSELNEVSIPTNDLEEMNMDIENNSFYKIYELLDEKIKNNVIQNIQKILNKKKIKLNVDLIDIFDDEEE